MTGTNDETIPLRGKQGLAVSNFLILYFLFTPFATTLFSLFCLYGLFSVCRERGLKGRGLCLFLPVYCYSTS